MTFYNKKPPPHGEGFASEAKFIRSKYLEGGVFDEFGEHLQFGRELRIHEGTDDKDGAVRVLAHSDAFAYTVLAVFEVLTFE